MSKWLEFYPFYKKGRKTPIVSVINKSTYEELGAIKWIGRGYWFIPKNDMRFDLGCLNDIQKYIENLKENEK